MRESLVLEIRRNTERLYASNAIAEKLWLK
jgi:hypothetical protein